MIFSLQKIKELANVAKINDQEVIRAIENIGFEIEDLYQFNNFKNIKFGLVTEIKQVQKNKKLSVLKIKFNDRTRDILTTAQNIKEQDVILSFVKGSQKDSLIFDDKIIDGIKSEGMLFSYLSITKNKKLLRDNEEQEAIIFTKEYLNKDPIEKLQLNDTLLEINILSNRSDAASYLIMAKEVSAFFMTDAQELVTKEPDLKNNILVKKGEHNFLTFIEGEGKVNISVEERILLMKHNIKSVNNLVDLSNLTLIMAGQPTHIYDANKIGKTFTTRLSSKKIKVLGKSELQLNNNLVVTADQKIVSLASVIGTEDSKVESKTNHFIIELGNFKAQMVRKSVVDTKISTIAAIQSSRRLDKSLIKIARGYLFSKLEHFSELNNLNALSKKKKGIYLDIKKIDQIAGFEISKTKKFKNALQSLKILGFKLNVSFIFPPFYRYDVKTIEDIAEEIFRFYGYSNMEIIKPNFYQKPSFYKKNNYKEALKAQGYNEVITYLLTEKNQYFFNPFNFENIISLKTYVSEKRSVIRNSQITSLLEIINYNKKQNIQNLNFYSIGYVNDGYLTLAIATTKKFEKLKQDIKKIFSQIYFKKGEYPFLHPGINGKIVYNNDILGFIGKMHPRIINEDLYVAEILLDKIPKIKIKDVDFGKEPLKFRDVTFSLKAKQEIYKFIHNIKCYKKEIKDRFVKNGKRMITVRFWGNTKEIENIDKKFN